MWVSIAMLALGLPVFVQTIIHGRLLGSNIVAALQCIGQVVAYSLLFTPSARRWMNREDERAKLGDVFRRSTTTSGRKKPPAPSVRRRSKAKQRSARRSK